MQCPVIKGLILAPWVILNFVLKVLDFTLISTADRRIRDVNIKFIANGRFWGNILQSIWKASLLIKQCELLKTACSLYTISDIWQQDRTSKILAFHNVNAPYFLRLAKYCVSYKYWSVISFSKRCSTVFPEILVEMSDFTKWKWPNKQPATKLQANFAVNTHPTLCRM